MGIMESFGDILILLFCIILLFLGPIGWIIIAVILLLRFSRKSQIRHKENIKELKKVRKELEKQGESVPKISPNKNGEKTEDRKSNKNVGSKKKGFLHYLGWVMGIIFVIGGMTELSKSFVIGLLYILAGLVIIPYINTLLHKKFEINLPVWLRVVLFFVILGFVGNMESSEIVQPTPVIQPSQKQIWIDSQEQVDEKEQETEKVSEEKEIIEKAEEIKEEVIIPKEEEPPEPELLEEEMEEKSKAEIAISNIRKLINRNYIMEYSQCMAWCQELEKLEYEDYPNLNEDDMWDVEFFCKGECRYDTRSRFILIDIYRDDLKMWLEDFEYDIENLGKDITPIETAPKDTTPKIKDEHGKLNVWHFDGVDDRIEMSDEDSLTPQSELSISAWVYISSISWDDRTAIVNKYDAGVGDRAYLLMLGKNRNPDKNSVCLTLSQTKNPYTGKLTCSKTQLSAGKWYHIVATFKANNQVIYINGINEIDDRDTKIADSIPNNNQPLYIGYFKTHEQSENSYFNGYMDEVAIYSKALSQAEVNVLYNDGTSYEHTGDEEGLIVFW